MSRKSTTATVAQNTPATQPKAEKPARKATSPKAKATSPATTVQPKAVSPVINGVVTNVAQPKAETITLYAHNDRNLVRFDVTAKPFAEGATATTLIVNPDNFVVLKAATAVPQGTTVFQTVAAAMRSLAVRQCKALQKACDEARDERIRKAECSFAAFAAERITLRYVPAAKLQKGSNVLWELSCNALRVDADMGDRDAIKDGAVAKAIELHTDLCDIREQKPGCLSGKKFENKLAEFYAGLNGYTVNGRRIHLLKGCVPTKHLLEEKVRENNKLVRRDADRFTVDDLNRRFRAMFYSVLFADDATLAYKAE